MTQKKNINAEESSLSSFNLLLALFYFSPCTLVKTHQWHDWGWNVYERPMYLSPKFRVLLSSGDNTERWGLSGERQVTGVYTVFKVLTDCSLLLFAYWPHEVTSLLTPSHCPTSAASPKGTNSQSTCYGLKPFWGVKINLSLV